MQRRLPKPRRVSQTGGGMLFRSSSIQKASDATPRRMSINPVLSTPEPDSGDDHSSVHSVRSGSEASFHGLTIMRSGPTSNPTLISALADFRRLEDEIMKARGAHHMLNLLGELNGLLSRRPQIMTSVDRVHVTKLGKMARASVGAKAWSAMCAAEFDKVIARFPLSKPTEAEVGSRGTHLISSAFGGMRAGPGTGGIRAGGATTRSPASAPAAPAPASVFTGTYHTASPPSMPPTQGSPGRRVITIGVSSGPSTRSAGGGHASSGSAPSGPLTPRAAAASARARASRKQQSTALSAAARAPAQPVSLKTSLSPPSGGGLKLTLPSDEPSPERRAMVSPSHAVPSSASSGVERQPGFSPGSRTSAAVAAPAPALALAPHVSGSPTSASRNATAQRLLATESRHSMRSERSLASHDSSNSLASALRTRGHLRRASIDSSTPLSRHRRRLSVDADGASPGAWSNDSPRNEATPPPQLDSPRRDSHYVEAKVIVGAGSTGLPIYDAAEAERNSIAVAISPSGQQIPKRQKKVVANFSTRMAAAEARERQRRLSGTHSRSRVSLLSASSNDPQSPR